MIKTALNTILKKAEAKVAHAAAGGKRIAAKDATPFESDWRDWVREMFPKYAPGEFAGFHEEFWEWAWEIEAGEYHYPVVPVWFRGGAKSMSVQIAIAALAARGKRNYVWYVSETQDQADAHVGTIGNHLLVEARIEQYYPDLAHRQVNKYGAAAGWKRERFWTASGFVVDAMGLESAVRGVKLAERRPDLIVFDDIDGKYDSPGRTQKKKTIITDTILGAGSPDCIVIFAQNLITKDSICSQLVDGRAKFLSDRKVIGPVPALTNFEYAQNETGTGYVITKGEPSWDWFGIEACQAKINTIGLDAFRRECQHEVDMPQPGALFPAFDECYHVITDAEFIAGYAALGVEVQRSPITGRAMMPERFTIARAQDVGSTIGHPNATAWMARPSVVHPLNDLVFCHRELIFPQNWYLSDTIEPVSLLPIAKEIHRLEGLHNEVSRIKMSLISHEAKGYANTYRTDLPPEYRLSFTQVPGDQRKRAGVTQIQNRLALNRKMPHPFRRYPVGHPLAGQPLPACPRILWVVADGQGELYVDKDGRMKARPATDVDGLMRARWEIPKYRNPTTATGQESEGVIKIDDDYIDAAKALAARFFPQPGGETEAEKIEAQIPAPLRAEALAAVKDTTTPEQKVGLWQARMGAIHALGLNSKGQKMTAREAALRRGVAKR